MKYLIVMRHSKAESEDSAGSDYSRLLSMSGRRDAVKISRSMLADEYPVADHIVSSIALRSFETAVICAEAFSLSRDGIVINENIYEGHLEKVMGDIANFPDFSSCAMVIGHNPLVEDLAARYCPKLHYHFSTSCAVMISFDIESWRQIFGAIGSFVYFRYVNRKDESLFEKAVRKQIRARSFESQSATDDFSGEDGKIEKIRRKIFKKMFSDMDVVTVSNLSILEGALEGIAVEEKNSEERKKEKLEKKAMRIESKIDMKMEKLESKKQKALRKIEQRKEDLASADVSRKHESGEASCR